MLAFLNVALEGLAWAGMAGNCPGGELDNMAQVVVQPLIKCVEENRDRGTSPGSAQCGISGISCL